MKLSTDVKTKAKYLVIGIVSSIAIFLVSGAVTALIPNPLFTRMTGKTALDYFFLTASSALMGSYIAIHLYKKNASTVCNAATYSGGVGSFLAFGCPICNKLLLLLFGATALLTYFQPYQPLLGFLSVGLMTGAVYFKLRR